MLGSIVALAGSSGGFGSADCFDHKQVIPSPAGFVVQVRHSPSRSGTMSFLRIRIAMLRMPTQTGNARPSGLSRNGVTNITDAMP
jgi:hypothetical protein